MFTVEKVACMKNLIGWKNHYNESDIPALPAELNETESGVYYNDLHPALRLDIVKASLPPDRNLEEYLETKVSAGINSLFGKVITEKKYEEYAKKVLANDVIIDKYGSAKNTIINVGRFVGFKIKPNASIGLSTVIKKIGLQTTSAQDPLELYLFHTSYPTVIKKIPVTVPQANGWTWVDVNLDLPSEGIFIEGSETYEIVGGAWVIGYYQDDLTGEAIDYNQLDWFKGFCSSCDGGKQQEKWRNLRNYMRLTPIYVPSASLPVNNGGKQDEMFDLTDCFEDRLTNYGMNFKISAECDLSTFFCEHKSSLTRALGLEVVHSVLQDIKFSQQMNFIEENLKHLIIRDLEGDKDTNYINIVDQLTKEIKSVNFDHSKVSVACLPCNHNNGVEYDVA